MSPTITQFLGRQWKQLAGRTARWSAALCMALLFTGTAQAAPGHWDFGAYGNIYGAREYQVWVPDGYTGS